MDPIMVAVHVPGEGQGRLIAIGTLAFVHGEVARFLEANPNAVDYTRIPHDGEIRCRTAKREELEMYGAERSFVD